MTYEPTEWKTGDIVTAEKLNHLEDGVGKMGTLILNTAPDTTGNYMVLDRTWQEINDAGFCVVRSASGSIFAYVSKVYRETTGSQLCVVAVRDFTPKDYPYYYVCLSPEEFPKWDNGEES